MALSRRSGNRFQASIWPGFVDAMTGLLLVLMFVITIFMVVQYVLRDTISGQETKLDALSVEITELARALGLEQKTSANLEDRVGALGATLNDAKSAAEIQAALIASLTTSRDAQEIALQQAENKITGFEAQVAGLLAQRKTSLGNIADLEATRAGLVSQQEALQLALAQARDEIDVGVETARLAAAKREALEALMADLRARNNQAHADNTDLGMRISVLETKISEEEVLKISEAAAAEALQERLKNADSELTAMTLALEAQRKRAENTLSMLAAAEAAGADLDIKLAAALLAEQQASVVRDATQAVLTQAQINETATSGQLSNVEAALALALLDAGERTAKNSSLQLKLGLAQGKTENLEALRDDLEIRLAEALADAELRGEEYKKLRVRLSQQEAALAAVGGDASDLEARLAQALAAKIEAGITAKTQLAVVEAALAKSLFLADENVHVVENLRVKLGEQQAHLEALEGQSVGLVSERASLAERLSAALIAKKIAEVAAVDKAEIEHQLAAALAAKLAAKAATEIQMSAAEQKTTLLAVANRELAQEEARSAESQRQTALLSQQVAALHTQLSGLQALLDDAKERDVDANVQLQSLGSELNMALARAAAEQKRRAELETAERIRLEAEAEDLEKYKSEFFGKLRDVIGAQKGVRIVGDRFVFSSEVLFPSAGAEMSDQGRAEVAKIAAILRSVIGDIPDGIDWVIRVDGHTDNRPLSGFGTFRDNWELSQARALSVVKYMAEFEGIPPDRLSANGFGEFQPVNNDDSDEARAQNRRIELKFTEK